MTASDSAGLAPDVVVIGAGPAGSTVAALLRGPKMFSWFIYRITSPAIREVFIYPSNPWRMQEALLSILAGDLFRATPIGPRFAAFKVVYYATCLTILPHAVRTFRWRRRHVREALQEVGSA